jgi:hypothetical protein
MHLVAIIDVNGAFDMRHQHKVERWTFARQFLFRLERRGINAKAQRR